MPIPSLPLHSTWYFHRSVSSSVRTLLNNLTLRSARADRVTSWSQIVSQRPLIHHSHDRQLTKDASQRTSNVIGATGAAASVAVGLGPAVLVWAVVVAARVNVARTCRWARASLVQGWSWSTLCEGSNLVVGSDSLVDRRWVSCLTVRHRIVK